MPGGLIVGSLPSLEGRGGFSEASDVKPRPERGGGSRCGGSVLGVEERAWPGRGLKEVQGAEPEAASRE